MSAFDTWVRAGGAGISAPNIMQNVNALNQQKENLTTSQNQNALYQLELAQAPEKQRMATRDDQQKQADREYQLMVRNAGVYSALYEAQDIDGALNIFKQTLGQIDPGKLTPEQKQQFQRIDAALQSPDPEDNKMVAAELYKNAKGLSTIGQQGGEAPAAVQTFNALVGKINDPNTSGVERQAAKINLGIDPRSTAPQVVDVGGVPFLWNPKSEQLSSFGSDGKPVTPETVASNKALISSTEKGAEQAVAQSGKIFEQLGPVNKSIGNIADAINAIDQGADTGAIMSRLPSITEASVTLDNVRGQMGLDIIGATTFGALSEGELQFALDTAIPTGLDEPALREWLVRKGEAQKKYSAELRKAAIYLGKPGNTVASYLDGLEVNGLYSTGQSEIPQAALDALKANPAMRDQFIAKYGAVPEGY